MAFASINPFKGGPFGAQNPVLVEVPKAPETHEVRRPMRSYLGSGALSDQISMALSPLLPGAPRPSRKVEVEVVREVAADGSDQSTGSANEGGSPPRYGG